MKDWVKDIRDMQFKYGVHKWIHDNKDNNDIIEIIGICKNCRHLEAI